MSTCRIAGCDAKALTKIRILCRNHDRRLQLYGDPLGGSASPGERADYFFRTVYTEQAECKLWPFAKVPGGYGVIQLRGHQHGVHRLACMIWNGPPKPDRPQAAHGECHDRACYNGLHLAWSDGPGQWMDQVRDGTAMLGAKNHATKLTPVMVREIRERYAEGGVGQWDLALEYGIRQPAVSALLRRVTWKHVL